MKGGKPTNGIRLITSAATTKGHPAPHLRGYQTRVADEVTRRVSQVFDRSHRQPFPIRLLTSSATTTRLPA